jgi:pyruvate kinase
MISKYRPNRMIIGVTPNERTAREMSVVWGVIPIFSMNVSTDYLEKRMIGAVKTVCGSGYLGQGDNVVVVSSSVVVGDMGIFASVYDVSSLIS